MEERESTGVEVAAPPRVDNGTPTLVRHGDGPLTPQHLQRNTYREALTEGLPDRLKRMGGSEEYPTSIQAVLNTRPGCSNAGVLEPADMKAPTPAHLGHGLQIAPPTASQAQAHLPPHPDGEQMVQSIQPLGQAQAMQKESSPQSQSGPGGRPLRRSITADLYPDIG